MTDLTNKAINSVPEFQRSSPNMQAFFKNLGIFLDEIGATIDGFKSYSDFQNMTDGNLSLFAEELGINFPRNMSRANRQKLAKDIVNLHRATGTEKSLRFMFNIIGLGVQIQYAWMKESDMISKPGSPYNYVFGDVTTPDGDGVSVATSGVYFTGKDTFSAAFQNVQIVGENYTPNVLQGQINSSPTTDRVVKLPYIRIVVTAQDYNTFTSDYLDPDTGKIYSYTQTEQFLITQEILNYFLDQARPANVAIIEISTPFAISDLLPYTFDQGTTSQGTSLNDLQPQNTTVNVGWRIDGTVTIGIPMDRYLLGETFGDFEFGNNNMNEYSSPSTVTVTRNYGLKPADNLVTNGNATLRKNTNFTGLTKRGLSFPGQAFTLAAPLTYGSTSGPSSTPGFTLAGQGYVAPDNLLPFDPTHIYKMHVSLKASAASGDDYLGIVCYDNTGKPILPENAWRNTAKNTTLYQAAGTGATTIYITKIPGAWPAAGNSYIQFGTKADFSDLPNFESYAYTAIDTSNSAFDILTLAHGLTEPYAVGTNVGFTQTGNEFVYCASGGSFVTPTTGFLDYYGKASGVNAPTVAPGNNQLRYGTVQIGVGLNLNATNVGGLTHNLSAIELIDLNTPRVQQYVPTRKNVHVNLTLPNDMSGGLVGSKSDRRMLALGTAVWQSLGNLQGHSMVSGTSVVFAQGTHDTVTRTVGSWVTEGFAAGDKVVVSGSGVASSGIYTVYAVSALVLTLTSNNVAANETTSLASVEACLDAAVSGYFAVALNITEPSVIGTGTLAVTQE